MDNQFDQERRKVREREEKRRKKLVPPALKLMAGLLMRERFPLGLGNASLYKGTGAKTTSGKEILARSTKNFDQNRFHPF